MRSSLVFSTVENAIFTVSRPNGEDIFYTIDESNSISNNFKKTN